MKPETVLSIQNMGNKCSHMNLWALSSIIRANQYDIEEILSCYEKGPKGAKCEDWEMDKEQFDKLLHDLNFHSSDIEIFEDFFRLLDVRNRDIINFREYVISIAPLTARNIPELFQFCIKVYDRTKRLMICKSDLLLIMKLVNQTCDFVGDKPLPGDAVHDYINSIFTTAGKIDGDIYYPDYMESLSMHPIVELFLSPQFQGNIAAKLQRNEEVEQALIDEEQALKKPTTGTTKFVNS